MCHYQQIKDRFKETFKLQATNNQQNILINISVQLTRTCFNVKDFIVGLT